MFLEIVPKLYNGVYGFIALSTALSSDSWRLFVHGEIVLFRDSNALMSQEPRNIFKRNFSRQQGHGKRVSEPMRVTILDPRLIKYFRDSCPPKSSYRGWF